LGDVTPADVAHAKRQKMGAIRNSILKGQGNLTGFIGEAVLMRALRACGDPVISQRVRHVDRHKYDVVVNGNPLEIKTKRIYTPKFYRDYDNVVNGKSCRQVGTYVFLRLVYDDATQQGKVWFVGCWPCRTFAANSRFLKRGDKVGYWTVKSSCFARMLGDCESWDVLLPRLRHPGPVTAAVVKKAAGGSRLPRARLQDTESICKDTEDECTECTERSESDGLTECTERADSDSDSDSDSGDFGT
jgi:hypothetical protein